MVVAAVDPPAAPYVWRGEEAEKRIASRRCRGRRRRARLGPRLHLEPVARCLLGEQPGRDLPDDFLVAERAHEAGLGHLADRREGKLPAAADLLHRLERVRAYHGDHALLALGDHDLPGLEIRLPQRHAVEMNVDSASLAGHLRERGGEAGRAEVLKRFRESALGELDARLDQLLPREGVTDLNGGPLLLRFLAELLACENACAADAVPAGSRPVQGYDVAGAARGGAHEPFARQQPDTHGVDETVVFIGNREHGITAHGRYAAAVAVVGNSLDCALEPDVVCPEPESVKERDRARPHRQDVADDPADSRCRPLERLHRRRVVVALDLERDRLALAEIDDPGVLTRALQNSLAGCRKTAQQQCGVLVRAMLRPQKREDRELEVVGLTTEYVADTFELPVGEAEGAVKRLFCDPRQIRRV